MTAHTDGPWQYDDHYVICQWTGGVIAEVWTSNMEANGKLMAAAPELLAACKDALWALDNVSAILGAARVQPTWTDPRMDLRAAITKAERG